MIAPAGIKRASAIMERHRAMPVPDEQDARVITVDRETLGALQAHAERYPGSHMGTRLLRSRAGRWVAFDCIRIMAGNAPLVARHVPRHANSSETSTAERSGADSVWLPLKGEHNG